MDGSRLDQVETFEDGETVVVEGEHGREMFVVQEGRVEVTKHVDGREVRLALLDRGAFFGEMSLLEGLPRHATVRAVGRVKLVVVDPGSLLLRIRRDPTFAFEMLQQLCHRIRELDDRLVGLLGERGALTMTIEAAVASAATPPPMPSLTPAPAPPGLRA